MTAGIGASGSAFARFECFEKRFKCRMCGAHIVIAVDIARGKCRFYRLFPR